jgi:hypothetical protein
VQTDPHQRANAVLNAFMQYMREAVPAPGAAKSPPRQQDAPSPAPAEHKTNPSLRLPAYDGTQPGITAPHGDEPTRETRIPSALAASLRPLPDDGIWNEPTRERPDVVEEMRARMPSSGHTSARPPAPPVVAERSIIVDEDIALTEPRSGTGEPRVAGESRADHFVSEMLVLIKYGHAEQVPREIDLWLKAYPDDLAGQLRVVEFLASRVDASEGLERLFTLAARALERREGQLARQVLEYVSREAPGDLRVRALRERVERG